MLRRTVADGRVVLGNRVIKNLQAVAWWVRDNTCHNQNVIANEFDAVQLARAKVAKCVENQRDDYAPAITELAKFNPDNFETHKEAFNNLLSLTFGADGLSPRYITRSDANGADSPTRHWPMRRQRSGQCTQAPAESHTAPREHARQASPFTERRRASTHSKQQQTEYITWPEPKRPARASVC